MTACTVRVSRRNSTVPAASAVTSPDTCRLRRSAGNRRNPGDQKTTPSRKPRRTAPAIGFNSRGTTLGFPVVKSTPIADKKMTTTEIAVCQTQAKALTPTSLTILNTSKHSTPGLADVECLTITTGLGGEPVADTPASFESSTDLKLSPRNILATETSRIVHKGNINAEEKCVLTSPKPSCTHKSKAASPLTPTINGRCNIYPRVVVKRLSDASADPAPRNCVASDNTILDEGTTNTTTDFNRHITASPCRKLRKFDSNSPSPTSSSLTTDFSPTEDGLSDCDEIDRRNGREIERGALNHDSADSLSSPLDIDRVQFIKAEQWRSQLNTLGKFVKPDLTMTDSLDCLRVCSPSVCSSSDPCMTPKTPDNDLVECPSTPRSGSSSSSRGSSSSNGNSEKPTTNENDKLEISVANAFHNPNNDCSATSTPSDNTNQASSSRKQRVNKCNPAPAESGDTSKQAVTRPPNSVVRSLEKPIVCSPQTEEARLSDVAVKPLEVSNERCGMQQKLRRHDDKKTIKSKPSIQRKQSTEIKLSKPNCKSSSKSKPSTCKHSKKETQDKTVKIQNRRHRSPARHDSSNGNKTKSTQPRRLQTKSKDVGRPRKSATKSRETCKSKKSFLSARERAKESRTCKLGDNAPSTRKTFGGDDSVASQQLCDEDQSSEKNDAPSIQSTSSINSNSESSKSIGPTQFGSLPLYKCHWSQCKFPSSFTEHVIANHVRADHMTVAPCPVTPQRTCLTPRATRGQTKKSPGKLVSPSRVRQARRQHVYSCKWTTCKMYKKPSKSLEWLNRHVMCTHAGQKRHLYCIVDGCVAKFATRYGLERHVQAHFRNNGENEKSAVKKLFKKKKEARTAGTCRPTFVDFMTPAAYNLSQAALMSLLPQTLTSKTPDLAFSGQYVEFNGKVIGRRTTASNETSFLVQWNPLDMIPDSWQSSESSLTRYIDIRRFPRSIFDAKFPDIITTSSSPAASLSRAPMLSANTSQTNGSSSTTTTTTSTSNCKDIVNGMGGDENNPKRFGSTSVLAISKHVKTSRKYKPVI